jgi:hypothetical protein
MIDIIEPMCSIIVLEMSDALSTFSIFFCKSSFSWFEFVEIKVSSVLSKRRFINLKLETMKSIRKIDGSLGVTDPLHRGNYNTFRILPLGIKAI